MEREKTINKVVNQVINKLEEGFKKRQKEAHYVVKYVRMSDDSLIGYHADSMGSMTQDKNQAKRYGGDPLKQMEVIARGASKSIERDFNKEKPEGVAGIFFQISKDIQEKYYEGMTNEPLNWYLDWESLSGFEPEQEFSVTRI